MRAVILCGNGPSFSTGVDVKQLAQGDVTAELFLDWHRIAGRLGELPMPLIVAIHGHCLGGGVMLTLTADYRLGADDLRIGLGAVRHGILPGSAPQLLPAIVGVAATRRLCLFGEYVDAEEALRIGLDRQGGAGRRPRGNGTRAGRARVRLLAGRGARVQGAHRAGAESQRRGIRAGVSQGPDRLSVRRAEHPPADPSSFGRRLDLPAAARRIHARRGLSSLDPAVG